MRKTISIMSEAISMMRTPAGEVHSPDEEDNQHYE